MSDTRRSLGVLVLGSMQLDSSVEDKFSGFGSSILKSIINLSRRAEKNKRETRTEVLSHLVSSITNTVSKNIGVDIQVKGPDKFIGNNIVESILDAIEWADLVIIDIGGVNDGPCTPNVGYETAIVHALGIPFVLLSPGSESWFYQSHIKAILNFRMQKEYDPNHASHEDLHDRIQDFSKHYLNRSIPEARARINQFSENPISAFYNGLPLVDASASAGTAAAYWLNAVKRFVWAEYGYLLVPKLKVQFKGNEVEASVERVLCILPDLEGGDELIAPDYLNRKIDDLLVGFGFLRVQVTLPLQNNPSVPNRDYASNVLGMPGRQDPQDPLINPLIVLEVPTIVNALREDKRFQRIQSNLSRYRARRFSISVDSFRNYLENYIVRADIPEDVAARFEFVAWRNLPDRLKEIRERLVGSGEWPPKPQ